MLLGLVYASGYFSGMGSPKEITLETRDVFFLKMIDCENGIVIARTASEPEFKFYVFAEGVPLTLCYVEEQGEYKYFDAVYGLLTFHK